MWPGAQHAPLLIDASSRGSVESSESRRRPPSADDASAVRAPTSSSQLSKDTSEYAPQLLGHAAAAVTPNESAFPQRPPAFFSIQPQSRFNFLKYHDVLSDLPPTSLTSSTPRVSPGATTKSLEKSSAVDRAGRRGRRRILALPTAQRARLPATDPVVGLLLTAALHLVAVLPDPRTITLRFLLREPTRRIRAHLPRRDRHQHHETCLSHCRKTRQPPSQGVDPDETPWGRPRSRRRPGMQIGNARLLQVLGACHFKSFRMMSCDIVRIPPRNFL